MKYFLLHPGWNESAVFRGRTFTSLGTLTRRVLEFKKGGNTMNAAMSFPVPSAVGSLEGDIQTVNRFPILSQEEELALARRFKTEDDLGAARELVLSHLRVVVSVARGYAGYGLPQADLIQEGNIGLMK